MRDAIKITPPAAPLVIKGELAFDNSNGLNPKPVETFLCCECGFAESYVCNPASLWKKHGEKSFFDE